MSFSDDQSSASSDVDLGQSVSAILRRALPALRISVRWIKSHLDHLHPPSSAFIATAGHLDTAVASEFWQSFDSLFSALAKGFPLDRLPKPDADGELILEEDVDVKGLAPLSLSLRGISAQSRERAELHPNDEQLLRIADLIRSAALISSSEVMRRLCVVLPPGVHTLNFPHLFFS
jgi:protein SMG7